MTVSERIQLQSFAYDPEFPPDVAAGLPLRAAAARPPCAQPPRVKRALRASVRAVAAKS